MTNGFPREEGYYPFHHRDEGWNIARITRTENGSFEAEVIGSSLLWNGDDQWYEHWGSVRWLNSVDFAKHVTYKGQCTDVRYQH